MKKFISAFSVVVISLFLLSVFGWMSVHISKGDKDFGWANEPIKYMYSFTTNASIDLNAKDMALLEHRQYKCVDIEHG